MAQSPLKSPLTVQAEIYQLESVLTAAPIKNIILAPVKLVGVGALLLGCSVSSCFSH